MSRPIELSVIIAASWSAEAARRTVASIGEDCGIEILVASDPSRVAPIALPGAARWVAGEAGADVPRLRRVGADAARGRVIAFVEDACEVGPGWAGAMSSAFRDGACLAVAGPVVQGEGASATGWAVYLAEYAPFAGNGGRSPAPPHPDPPPSGGRGPEVGRRILHPPPSWGGAVAQPTRLAGINFACRREALVSSPEIREAELSLRLAGSIRRVDGATVRHTRHYRFREALADRWRFGRTYGRDRWSDRPGPLRRLGLAAAPAILAIQLARLAACIARSPGLLRPALTSSPKTLALLTAWSLGEALGWAEARPPSSRRRGTAAPPPASAIARAASE